MKHIVLPIMRRYPSPAWREVQGRRPRGQVRVGPACHYYDLAAEVSSESYWQNGNKEDQKVDFGIVRVPIRGSNAA